MPRTDRLRTNTSGEGEAVMYPFVLVIAFMMIIGFLAVGLSKYARSGEISTEDYSHYDVPFGMYDMTVITGDETDDRLFNYTDAEWGYIEGYNVSSEDILDHVPYPTDDDPFKFSADWDDKYETKYVHVIMDNRDYNPDSTDLWEKYEDFIAIRREAPAGVVGVLTWGTMGGKWYNAAIPFTSIQNNFVNATNVSLTDFKIGNAHDTIYVNVTDPGLDAFVTGLWSGEFKLYYGWSKFRIEEIDFWAALSMLFVDDIPGVDPLINFVFHAIAIAVVTFVLFNMALRIYEAVIPL